MSGGGGQTTTTKTDPPAYIQPFLTDIAQTANRNSGSPPAFFPGPTFLGPTQGQIDAFGQQFDYANSVYGGARAPSFGEATGALSGNLTGNNGLGQFAGGITPLAQQSLQQGFGGGAPNFNPSAFTPGANYNPSQYTPGVNYDPTGITGTLAGSGPTASAYSRALSGQPDYAGLQSSIDAANAPILRQFNEELLPQLSQRAAFLGNPTGGIKTLNKVLPQLGQQLGENALRATEAERQRALGEQTQTAQFLTGAGLQGAGTLGGFGLQAAGLGQSGAGQAAGLGLQGYGLGLQGAAQNAGIQSDFRGQALGLGQLAGGFQGQLAGNQLQAAGQFPQLAQAGMLPGALSGQFADFGRQFQDQALQDQIQRFSYYQNLPNQTLQNYSGIINGFAGLGNVQSGMGPGPNRTAGALGGALSGASAGSYFGPYGAAIGGVLGAAGGYFA